MAYDEHLAARVRELLADEEGLTEKNMFGGVAFLLAGKMAVGVSSKGGLMVRVQPERTEELISDPHVGPFEMKDKPIDGWVRVDENGVDGESDLSRWVAIGVERARSL